MKRELKTGCVSPEIEIEIKKYSGILGAIRFFLKRLRFFAGRIKAGFLEWRYDVETSAYQKLSGTVKGDGNYRYQPTPYGRLEKAMRFLKPAPTDVFVDVGCGKGRAVFVAATHRFKKVIGIEADKNVYDIAVKNADNFRKRRRNTVPIELFHMDAVDFDPREGTVFFMFNPFGPAVMRKVLDNIKKSFLSNPRKIRIVYYTPHCKELMAEQAWLSPAGVVENEFCPVWESNLSRKSPPVQGSAIKH